MIFRQLSYPKTLEYWIFQRTIFSLVINFLWLKLRWNHHSNAGYETQHFVEPNMTRSFFELPVQVRLAIKIEQKSNQILVLNSDNIFHYVLIDLGFQQYEHE